MSLCRASFRGLIYWSWGEGRISINLPPVNVIAKDSEP